jgi:hypothetical protein
MTLRVFVIALLSLTVRAAIHAQEAAAPKVDLPKEPELPAIESTAPAAPLAPSPDVPELSQLDEAFKRTSIGKAADEFRQRVEIRKLQNQVSNDESINAARSYAEAASTDLEKRERLRDYYELYYGKMRRMASSDETRKALDELKEAHVKLLAQPRVRPVPGASVPPVPKKDKTEKAKKSRFGRTKGS